MTINILFIVMVWIIVRFLFVSYLELYMEEPQLLIDLLAILAIFIQFFIGVMYGQVL